MANDYVGWGLILGIEDSLDDFINDATEVVNSLGTGLPPRDLAAFSSQSTEDGIKLTFTPPAQTYIDDGGTDQFAVMPAGVLIRYSDTGYPRTPDEGKFGYDYKPTGDWVTTSQECTIVGLTKDTKYYFTAFPYSTEHVYNKNQVTANRTEMTWVGNKGTISVTVQTPEGYEGTLGEYTITLVDQASASPQNVEKTATGAGLTQFGGLTAGKSYKVRLSSTADLQAPPDSEVITIVGGVNYDVTMTYALMYGTITVNVSTQPAGMPIGRYTVTLTPNDSTGALSQQGNNSQAVVFNNVKNGVVYTVGLSAINHYTANANGTVTAVGGKNVSHNAKYTFSATLQDSSWEEIELISGSGKAKEFFSIGDKKTVRSKKLNGSFDDNGNFTGSESDADIDYVFSHYDGNYMAFTSLSCPVTALSNSGVRRPRGTAYTYFQYSTSGLCQYLSNNYRTLFPENHKYLKNTYVISQYIWVNFIDNRANQSLGSVPVDGAGEGAKYVYVPPAWALGAKNQNLLSSEFSAEPWEYFTIASRRSLGTSYCTSSLSCENNVNYGNPTVYASINANGNLLSRSESPGWSFKSSQNFPLCFFV